MPKRKNSNSDAEDILTGIVKFLKGPDGKFQVLPDSNVPTMVKECETILADQTNAKRKLILKWTSGVEFVDLPADQRECLALLAWHNDSDFSLRPFSSIFNGAVRANDMRFFSGGGYGFKQNGLSEQIEVFFSQPLD